MGDTTKIAWTEHTFNPWIGCRKVSDECKHCYAEGDTPARRARSEGVELWGPPSTSTRQITKDSNWAKPLKWARDARSARTRRRVFCASQADIFEDFPGLDKARERLWKLIEATEDSLDWQLLTKRPENIQRMVPPSWLERPLRGVWYGATVGTQKSVDRIGPLLEVPAHVRFLSIEPLLEPVVLPTSALEQRFVICPSDDGSDNAETNPCVGCTGNPRDYESEYKCDALWSGINWIIIGGESGYKARPFQLEWARALIAQARAHRVAVFVKQMGARAFANGLELVQLHRKGGAPEEWPEDLRIQEMPVPSLALQGTKR